MTMFSIRLHCSCYDIFLTRCLCLFWCHLTYFHQVVYQRMIKGLEKYLSIVIVFSWAYMIYAAISDMSYSSTLTMKLEESECRAHFLFCSIIFGIKSKISGVQCILEVIISELAFLVCHIFHYIVAHRFTYGLTCDFAIRMSAHTVTNDKQSVIFT